MKAARAIANAVRAEKTALRVPLGGDAVDSISIQAHGGHRGRRSHRGDRARHRVLILAKQIGNRLLQHERVQRLIAQRQKKLNE